jgi:outer membrane receptor protein involved in Fe transport
MDSAEMDMHMNGRRRLSFLLLCALAFAGAIPLSAQTMFVSGTVRDGNTHRPVPDVNIDIPGSGSGATTDAAGTYTLRIVDADKVEGVVFRHVAYENRVMTPAELKSSGDVFLLPRIIPFESTEITGMRREGAAARDIPQTVSTLEAREFDVRGYVDAGDLLRTEHSIQVDEDFSGRKRISIRGGNSDEVIVLYDGVRLNGNYTSDFDLAMIELSDIERFEIIKGSNTTLYGSEAFSGVINIVPKLDRDYTVRLHQQIGSYDSGIWGLQLFRRFGRFAGSYSLRSGGMSRSFEDIPEDRLSSSSLHHSGGMSYSLSDERQETPTLALNWRLASLEYSNQRDGEQLDDQNRFASLQYNGSLPLLGEITIVGGYNGLRQDMTLRASSFSVLRVVQEDGAQGRFEKRWTPGMLDLLFSYQFAHARLDVDDQRRNQREQPVGIEANTLRRSQHGFVAVGKLQGETGSSFFRTFDFNASLRQDFVLDRQDDVLLRSASLPDGIFGERDWSHTLFKFAVNLKGIKEHFLLDVFLGYGNNVRYPTLFQQVNSPALLDPSRIGDPLDPETNRSVEAGASLTRSLPEGAVSGWEVQGGFFQNSYDNKFRSISTPGIPLTMYDNVDDAQLSGLEGKAGLFFWGKKVRVEFGISRYYISDKSAFPFKSDRKRTIGLLVNHAGYSLHVFHFAESEQIGLLRQVDGRYAEAALPSFSNLDLHASKFFEFGGLTLFVNVSLRNVLTDDNVLLSGLALRDRRYYLTAGIQY